MKEVMTENKKKKRGIIMNKQMHIVHVKRLTLDEQKISSFDETKKKVILRIGENLKFVWRKKRGELRVINKCNGNTIFDEAIDLNCSLALKVLRIINIVRKTLMKSLRLENIIIKFKDIMNIIEEAKILITRNIGYDI